MKDKIFYIDSPAEMARFGEVLAGVLLPGDVLLLDGELGAGKTTLTQAIARGLGVGGDYPVTSPSFALLHEYKGRWPVYHMDCYRLDGEDDIESAGLAEYIGMDDGISIVEWASRLGRLTPAGSLHIYLKVTDENRREMICQEDEEKWAERLTIIKQGFECSQETADGQKDN